MTDIEITRACYAAMGDLPHTVEHEGEMRFGFNKRALGPAYDPLHDDAQAMALVKKFRLYIDPDFGMPDVWQVADGINDATSGELNRAICECVARMQKAKR